MRYHTPSLRTKSPRDSKVSLDRVRYKEKVDAILCSSRACAPPLKTSGISIANSRMESSSPERYRRQGSYYQLYDCNPERRLRSSLKQVVEASPRGRRAEVRQPLSFGQFYKGVMIAEGKFGKVFAVKHKETGCLYAMKVMSKRLIQAENYQSQLVQEIKLQSLVDDPNVIRLYGFFSDADNVYLIQQFGMDPNLYFQLKTSRKQKFDTPHVQSLVKMIALGLDAIHSAGVVHRDLKPENIIMSLGVPKICDFGWSAALNRKLNCFCGTLDYVAPEIIRGEDHNQKVDLWCLGVLTFQLLTGFTPFSDQSEQVVFKKIVAGKVEFPGFLGENQRKFVGLLLRQRPEERPSVAALLQHQFLQVQ